jgi:hypothetical protein
LIMMVLSKLLAVLGRSKPPLFFLERQSAGLCR